MSRWVQMDRYAMQVDGSSITTVRGVWQFSEEEMAYLKADCEKISGENLPDDMWETVTKLYDTGNA